MGDGVAVGKLKELQALWVGWVETVGVAVAGILAYHAPLSPLPIFITNNTLITLRPEHLNPILRPYPHIFIRSCHVHNHINLLPLLNPHKVQYIMMQCIEQYNLVIL